MINKIGKIGRININANDKLKRVWIDHDINPRICENCGYNGFAISNAHRHKRIWYRGQPELLSEFKQVVRLCMRCHDDVEYDKSKSEELFDRLRGKE